MSFSFKALFKRKEVEDPNKAKIEALEKSFIQLTDRVYQLETVVKMLLLAQTQLNEDVSVVLSALQGSSSLDKHMMRFGADDDDGLLNQQEK